MINVPLRLKYLSPLLWLPIFIHDQRIGHLRKYDERILLSKFDKFGYKIKRAYYPGHFEKALIVSLGMFGIQKENWNKWCEFRDKRKEHKKHGASNICVIFQR